MTKDILANFLPIAACITRTRRTVWRGQPVVPDFARTGTAASAAAPVAANMPSSAVHIEVRRLRVMRARVYPEAARLAQTAFQPGSWLTSTTPQTLEWNAGLDVLVNATITSSTPSGNPTASCISLQKPDRPVPCSRTIRHNHHSTAMRPERCHVHIRPVSASVWPAGPPWSFSPSRRAMRFLRSVWGRLPRWHGACCWRPHCMSTGLCCGPPSGCSGRSNNSTLTAFAARSRIALSSSFRVQ